MEEEYLNWMKRKVPQFLIGVDPATGDFKISDYVDEHSKTMAYFQEQLLAVAGVPSRYRNHEREEISEKKVRDEREYLQQVAAFQRFIQEGSIPKPYEETYEEKMQKVKYSLKDIQSLIGVLTLGIEDEKIRSEIDETFAKWREGEIGK